MCICVSQNFVYIWLLEEMTELCITVCGSGGWTVWYSCINTKSAWRSAADVKVLLTSSIFLPVPSRPPCCNAPHCIQLCGVKSVESEAPLGHQPLDTYTYESQPQCQHHDQHASYSCLKDAWETTLSVYTQTAQALEYIIYRLHNDLDGIFLLWLHILYHAKFRYLLHAEFWGSHISFMKHATWYCLIECTKTKLDSR